VKIYYFVETESGNYLHIKNFKRDQNLEYRLLMVTIIKSFRTEVPNLGDSSPWGDAGGWQGGRERLAKEPLVFTNCPKTY
jgi:hypothetical protein